MIFRNDLPRGRRFNAVAGHARMALIPSRADSQGEKNCDKPGGGHLPGHYRFLPKCCQPSGRSGRRLPSDATNHILEERTISPIRAIFTPPAVGGIFALAGAVKSNS